jgi:hypothetical protein
MFCILYIPGCKSVFGVSVIGESCNGLSRRKPRYAIYTEWNQTIASPEEDSWKALLPPGMFFRYDELSDEQTILSGIILRNQRNERPTRRN